MSEVEIPLHAVAHSRAGDKGNRSNLSLIPYDPALYPLLAEQVTEARVLALFAHRGATRCTRYDLPLLRRLQLRGRRRAGGWGERQPQPRRPWQDAELPPAVADGDGAARNVAGLNRRRHRALRWRDLFHVRHRASRTATRPSTGGGCGATRWRNAATTPAGARISRWWRRSAAASSASARRCTRRCSPMGGMTGSMPTRPSPSCGGCGSCRSSISATSACPTGSAISRTRPSPRCSPIMPGPSRRAFPGCSSIRR